VREGSARRFFSLSPSLAPSRACLDPFLDQAALVQVTTRLGDDGLLRDSARD